MDLWYEIRGLLPFNLKHLLNPINPGLENAPVADSFRSEVIRGLKQSPKRIPSKFFYDKRGSQLFEAITGLDEYYLTRTEVSILREHVREMAALIGPDALIIEFGTGAGVKTKMLLEALERPRAYVPIDISREQLTAASIELDARFSSLEIYPICADYTAPISLPSMSRKFGRTVVFFPGSTIGNFTPQEAKVFLRNIASLIGPEGALLIGFDRVKDRTVLEAAYNDRRGVTAAFNRNLMQRIGEEFGASLSSEDFDHFAFFNALESRIEMHLVSREEQMPSLDDVETHFAKGEHIVTEYSYKYTTEAFGEILGESGFEVQKRWRDSNEYFEVCYANVHM